MSATLSAISVQVVQGQLDAIRASAGRGSKLGVFIIPKWLINDSGWIPILFGSFLELPKNQSNIDPTAP